MTVTTRGTRTLCYTSTPCPMEASISNTTDMSRAELRNLELVQEHVPGRRASLQRTINMAVIILDWCKGDQKQKAASERADQRTKGNIYERHCSNAW